MFGIVTSLGAQDTPRLLEQIEEVIEFERSINEVLLNSRQNPFQTNFQLTTIFLSQTVSEKVCRVPKNLRATLQE